MIDEIKRQDIDALAARNIRFKNRHQGQRCFILATGPSVQRQDLNLLKDEICIAVSQFYLHQDIKTIAPRYHLIAPWHPPFDFAIVQKVFDDFANYYSDLDVTYFFGYRRYAYSILDFLTAFPTYCTTNMNFLHYNGIGLDESNYTDGALWDICRPLFEIRTVIYGAIQLAAYMGFDEIYLIGCDHDYLEDVKRVSGHHFYQEQKGVNDAQHLGAFSTEKWFKEYHDRWCHYRLMQSYLESHHQRIYNATAGGMLDVFPRKNLTELVVSKKKSRKSRARLHIGCGDVDLPGFFNIDARPLPHVDLVKSDIFDLSEFENDSAELIYMCHILEHIRRDDLSKVFREARRVLKTGGRLRLSVPDFDHIIAIYLDAGRRIEAIEKPLMGGQEYPQNYHYTVFNRKYLQSRLETAGFSQVRSWEPEKAIGPQIIDWSTRRYVFEDCSYPISLNLEAVK